VSDPLAEHAQVLDERRRRFDHEVRHVSPEEEGRSWGDPVYLAALQEHESAEFFPRPTGRA
jgi:hypothetical protein